MKLTLALIAVPASVASVAWGVGSPLPSPILNAPQAAQDSFVFVPLAESSHSAEFTRVSALDVDSQGRVYVGDFGSERVTVLNPQGAVVETIGRRGDGPGEFRSVSNVQVLNGDTLLVYDRDLARLTLFAPETRAVVSTTLLSSAAMPTTPYWVEAAVGDRLVAAYRKSYRPADDPKEDARRVEVVRVLRRDGSVVRDSLLTFPGRQFLVARKEYRVSVAPHPFGRKGIIALGHGREVLFGWTDTLRLQVYDLDDGGLAWSAALERDPVRVTRRDLEAVRSEISERFHDALRQRPIATWPPLRALVRGDDGSIWIGTTTPVGEPTEWAAFDAAGVYLGSAWLDENIELLRISNGKAYGVLVGPLDVPSIVVFAIKNVRGDSSLSSRAS